jgi:hypothetical protein
MAFSPDGQWSLHRNPSRAPLGCGVARVGVEKPMKVVPTWIFMCRCKVHIVAVNISTQVPVNYGPMALFPIWTQGISSEKFSDTYFLKNLNTTSLLGL